MKDEMLWVKNSCEVLFFTRETAPLPATEHYGGALLKDRDIKLAVQALNG